VKFKLAFWGKKSPAIHPLYPDRVERIVEAKDAEEAALRAYDHHEHCHRIEVTPVTE
jgi:hypothetical protein